MASQGQIDHQSPPTQPAANSPVPAGQLASTPTGGAVAAHPAATTSVSHPARRAVMVGLVVLLLALAAYYGIPAARRMMNTVSTDDAYVNGHVTFVAPRISGQVIDVLVDDNQRVRKGDKLVELDKKPYQIALDAKRASYEVAKANVVVASDSVRGAIGQTRASRFKLQHAIEDVNNQVASLRATFAAYQNSGAKLQRAEADYQRGLALQNQKPAGVISPEEIDRRKETYLVADAQAKQSLQQVLQIRASLGLPQLKENEDPTVVPADIDQNFSTVRQAVAEVLQNAAPLGILPSSFDIKPKQLIEEFYKRDPDGNLDKIYAKIIDDAPAIKLAQAKLLEAQSELDQAELNLSYCDVLAEIDGVVTRREVNPGNNLIAGQSVMALRSIADIWVDANFKETQLSELRIGLPVDLEVDMYGSHQAFKGRISGFTMGTGSTLALLPAENATGNFVKVVQRIPVKIEILDYDPDKTPLLVGASVTPYVRFREPPTGPGAGKLLQPEMARTPASGVPIKTAPPVLRPAAAKPDSAPPVKPESRP